MWKVGNAKWPYEFRLAYVIIAIVAKRDSELISSGMLNQSSLHKKKKIYPRN